MGRRKSKTPGWIDGPDSGTSSSQERQPKSRKKAQSPTEGWIDNPEPSFSSSGGVVVEENLSPQEARRRFEIGSTSEQEARRRFEIGSTPEQEPRFKQTSLSTIEDARNRYLAQANSPEPSKKAAKDRSSLKRRKKFASKKNDDQVFEEWEEPDVDSRYTPLMIDLADWIGFVTGKKVPFDRFFEKLRSGVLLCEFCDTVNKLSGDITLPRINMSSHTSRGLTFIRYNVEVYIIWCKAFGVQDIQLMDVSDLVDCKSIKMVLGNMLAVGREMRARGLPCPVIAVLEQTYKMNYDNMIDIMLEDDAIIESQDIQNSLKVKKKRYELLKSKAQSGQSIRRGVLDDDTRNIQEDIISIIYNKGYKKDPSAGRGAIMGWQETVRKDHKSRTLPTDFREKLRELEKTELRYGQTLPRNYGSTSPVVDEEEEEIDNEKLKEELRNFKTPDLIQKEPPNEKGKNSKSRRISFGFKGNNKEGKKQKYSEQKDKVTEPIEPSNSEYNYTLTIPEEQFELIRDSHLLGEILGNSRQTEAGEYIVDLNEDQYREFQRLLSADKVDAVSQDQGESLDKKKKKPKKKKKEKRKRSESENQVPTKPKKKGIKRWKSQNTFLSDNDKDENKPKRRFSFSKNSDSEQDGKKRKNSVSSLFGRRRKSVDTDSIKIAAEVTPKSEDTSKKDFAEASNNDSRNNSEQFGVWPNIQTRLGDQDDPSLSMGVEGNKSEEKIIDPRDRIPPHLSYRRSPTPSPDTTPEYKRYYKPEPEVIAPDYKQKPLASEHDNVDGDDVSHSEVSVSEYSIVSLPIVGKRKRKKRKRRRMPSNYGTYNSDVGCLECFTMIFCPWRWV